MLAELGRVLVDEFHWESAYAEDVVAQLVHLGELVELDEVVQDIEDVLPTTRCWRRPPRARRT